MNTKSNAMDLQEHLTKFTVATKSASTQVFVPESTLPDQFRNEPTISSQIKAMSAAGYSKGAIAKSLSEHYGRTIRYQHVRNVLVAPVKKV